ncbi:MAG: putative DNA binding domain-containing protein [Paludibacter sp.]|nr:putative DNA binding domain-containing protein [Paludibacter sp.]
MKDEQLLKSLIKEGESEQLEFKEVVRKEEIAKSLCAFLNGNGGIVLIGIQDNGRIKGVLNAEKYEMELKQYLFQSIIPEAPITITTEKIGTDKVILAKVWNGSKPPYIFDGTIYFRRGSSTVKASPNEISTLITERQKTELHWERQPALGVDIDDLDDLELRKTIKDLVQFGRGKIFSENEVEEFLTYYGLYHNGNLTNAAVVLFAKEPTRHLPQCRIRLTVFRGSKTSDSYAYDRILEGNLFRNIEEVLQFFEVNIATISKFSDKKWLREDKSYPKRALREGLMNAIIHRDYSSVSGTVNIAFYPDHLEIINSGELYGGYSPSDLTKNHLSIPRNPDIAHICFLRQMIEKIGRGTVLMIEDCENKSYPKPKWESKLGATTLVFPDVTVTTKTDDVASDAVNDAVNDAVSKELTSAVIIRLVEIVKYIALNQGTKVNDLVGNFKVSERTIKENLKVLTEANLIVYSGSKKAGFYILTKDLHDKLHE